MILIAPTAENFQGMFDMCILDTWCIKWRLTCNYEKTKVPYFRTSSVPQSTLEEDIKYVYILKYLGLCFSDHLNMTKTVKELAKSESRAFMINTVH